MFRLGVSGRVRVRVELGLELIMDIFGTPPGDRAWLYCSVTMIDMVGLRLRMRLRIWLRLRTRLQVCGYGYGYGYSYGLYPL